VREKDGLALLHSLREHLFELVIDGVAGDFAEFIFHRDPHRLLVDERIVGLGAPPVKLLTSVAPVATFPLAHGRGDVAVHVGFVGATKRELPAHFGLPIERPLPRFEGGTMQCTTTATGKVGRVQKHARTVDDTSDMDAFVVACRRSLPTSCRGVLPLIVANTGDTGAELASILSVGEMRTMRAAALTQRAGILGEHALTSTSKDAGPVARQEGHVEEPRSIFVGVLERQELVQVFRSGHEEKVAAGCDVETSVGEVADGQGGVPQRRPLFQSVK
jgi:hypothetical protein